MLHNEHSANRALYLQKRKAELEQKIKEYKGIVPEKLYAELMDVELKLLKINSK